jgi:riboflavin-specific deaminase-like protein
VKAALLSAVSVNGILTLARGDAGENLAAALAVPAEVLAVKYEIRRRYGAIMVGTGTVLAANPHLTSHRVPGFTPVRVAVDRRGRIPPHFRFLDGSVRTLVGVCRKTPRSYLDLLAARGVEAVEASSADGSAIDLARLLSGLAARGIGSLAVEGGGTIARALLSAGLVERLHLIALPAVLDAASVNLFEGGGGALVRLHLEEVRPMGDYAFLHYRVDPAASRPPLPDPAQGKSTASG